MEVWRQLIPSNTITTIDLATNGSKKFSVLIIIFSKIAQNLEWIRFLSSLVNLTSNYFGFSINIRFPN